MKPALVTGASGFLGWHVARFLLERGIPVRALARRPGSITELPVEVVSGDLRDPASLQRAVAGCSLLFHVAADYRLWAKNPQELYDSNVEGTRNLLEAARNAGLDRVVYTSTVGCIGFQEGREADENSPVALEMMTGAYKRSKFMAEQVALECARRGDPVVIVNPTAPVGDRDLKPTPTGQTIVDFLKGQMPAFVDTGLNLVDVREVAEAHWLACERGTPGERYILGSQNLTLSQILQRLGSISGLPAPTRQIPWAIAFAAGVASTAWASITGNPPRVPVDAVRMARKKMFVTHAKATQTLGFQPSPPDAALARAVDWFRNNGYC